MIFLDPTKTFPRCGDRNGRVISGLPDVYVVEISRLCSLLGSLFFREIKLYGPHVANLNVGWLTIWPTSYFVHMPIVSRIAYVSTNYSSLGEMVWRSK